MSIQAEDRLAPEQHDTLSGIPDPSESASLVGHVEAQQMLLAAQEAGRLPHAIVLAGPQGIGKATFAFAFARHLLSNAQRSPSGQFTEIGTDTPLFRQIASGAHPAVLHLTRPVNERSKGFKSVISVDEIRRIGAFSHLLRVTVLIAWLSSILPMTCARLLPMRFLKILRSRLHARSLF